MQCAIYFNDNFSEVISDHFIEMRMINGDLEKKL